MDLAAKPSYDIYLKPVEPDKSNDNNDVTYFELIGFNPHTYPLFEKNGGLENVYNTMRSLLDASRTNFSSEKYGDNVLRHVAKECID